VRDDRCTPVLLAFLLGVGSCHQDSESSTATRSQALNSSPSIGDFVLYAEQSVKLGSFDHIIAGDVGVAIAAPTGYGPQVTIGDHVVDIHGNLISPSIALGPHSHVGDVQTLSLTDTGGMYHAQYPFPFTQMPRVPLATAPAFAGPDISIPREREQTIGPGIFGNVTVYGELVLSAGAYSFSSLSVAACGRVFARRGGVTINIRDTFHTDDATRCPARVEPMDEDDCDHHDECTHRAASNFSLFVSGGDSPDDSAVSLGAGTVLRALVAAPHGTISFADGVNARGAFAAFDIRAGAHVELALDTGFVDNNPGDQGSQRLSGYLGNLSNTSYPVLGPVPPTTPVVVSFGLPTKNDAALSTFVDAVSDPHNPMYRQYLSMDQLQQQYSPSDADYASLVAWAQAYGLTVTNTFSNKMLITVTASASQVERAIHSNLIYRQQTDGLSGFVAVDREPSLDLALPIQWISGLTNYITPRVLYSGETSAFCDANPMAHDNQCLGFASGDKQGQNYQATFMAQDLRNAYLDINTPCTLFYGAGQTIGIFSWEAFRREDFDAYEAQQNVPFARNGWPTPTDAQVDTREVSAITHKVSNDGMANEISLDVQMALAIAPKANVLVFQGDPNGNDETIYAAMVDEASLTVVSVSAGMNKSPTMERLITMLAARGVTVLVGSGDEGDVGDPGNNEDIPYQTLVGGTELNVNDVVPSPVQPTNTPWWYCDEPSFDFPTSCYYNSENTWDGTGGGIMNSVSASSCFPFPQCPPVGIPGYQDPAVMAAAGGSTTFRNFPDLAMAAHGVFYYTNHAQSTTQGTSIAAPLFAGFIAATNEYAASNNVGRVGFVNPAIYAIGETRGTGDDLYSSSFFDVADGAFNKGVSGFQSQPGYDLTTGWGGPRCGLMQQLATNDPTVPQTYTETKLHIAIGVDGIADDSSLFVDFYSADGTTLLFNKEVKVAHMPGWGPGSEHDLLFALPEQVGPADVARAQLHFVPSDGDAADISGLHFALVRTRGAQACVADRSGKDQSVAHLTSASPDAYFDSVAFDPGRIHPNGCTPWGGSIAFTSVLTSLDFTIDTGHDDLEAPAGLTASIIDGGGVTRATGTLHVQGQDAFGQDTEWAMRMDFSSTPLSIDDIHTIELDVAPGASPVTWQIQALLVSTTDNRSPWESECVFNGTQTDTGGPYFSIDTGAGRTSLTIAPGGCP